VGSCEFCRIINREVPAQVVHESESTLSFFPLSPATMGHTLVIPKLHVPNFLECDDITAASLSSTVATVGRALQEVFEPQGMNVITSAGAAASQSVMHLHFHIVPRWDGDAIGAIWPPQIPTDESVLNDMADAVRQYCHSEQLGRRNPDKG
jgi:histidine triad (HIT) family protein